MKGGWIIPAGSFLKKDYAYLWKLFNDVRTITGCFILAEGYFSFWLRVISTILPLFHSPLKPSCPPQTAFLRAGILALLQLKKDQTFFPYHVTTFSQVLKRFYIRPPLSPTLSTRSFTSLPLNGHFHLKDAWSLSDGVLEMVLSLSPSGGNGFWVAGCNRNTLFRLSQRRESGWENGPQLPLANVHLCQQPKWNFTSVWRERVTVTGVSKRHLNSSVSDLWPQAGLRQHVQKVVLLDISIVQTLQFWLSPTSKLLHILMAHIPWLPPIFNNVSSTLSKSSELNCRVKLHAADYASSISPCQHPQVKMNVK